MIDLTGNRVLAGVGGGIAREQPAWVERRKSPRRDGMLLMQKNTQHAGEVRHPATVGRGRANQQNPHAISSLVAAGARSASAAPTIAPTLVAMPPVGFVWGVGLHNAPDCRRYILRQPYLTERGAWS